MALVATRKLMKTSQKGSDRVDGSRLKASRLAFTAQATK